ncbi:MAG: hypothetical protein ACK44M_09950 [Chloroflexus sp.]
MTTASVVALTFVEGAYPLYPPLILNRLGMHQLRATFFWSGNMQPSGAIWWPKSRRAAMQLAITFHRVRMIKISYAHRWRELRLTQPAVAPYGASLFRPPDGSHWYSSWLDTRLVGCDIGGWTAYIED